MSAGSAAGEPGRRGQRPCQTAGVSVAAVSRWTGAAGLAGAGILHAAWGAGSSWPLADRAALADAVVGRPAAAGAPGVPGAGQCFTVAGALVAAAAVVAHPPRRIPRLDTLHRAGVTGVVAVLASRGLLGAAGLTDLVSRGSVSDRFRRLDRRVYSPLCLGLAGLSAAGVLLDRADAAPDAAPAG
ncbi:hypothetical protein Franean1_2303 [Parafrankia sp. EAN1pec]|nr:hypothetical protein Franean1_2303 [Frankia sp. EAN1pec]